MFILRVSILLVALATLVSSALGQSKLPREALTDFAELPNFTSEATFIISSGAATPTRAAIVLAAESGTADTLDNLLVSGWNAGDAIRGRADTGDTLTITHGVGNIVTDTGENLVVSGNELVTFRVTPSGAIASKSGGASPAVRRYGHTVNLQRDHGAVCDYTTDDSSAFSAALTAAAGGTLFIEAGVCRVVGSFTIPAGTDLVGVGSAKIAAFPQTSEVKNLLRPGFKDQLPGSVLIFDGSPTDTYTASRSDGYASVGYALRMASSAGSTLRNLSIIQDIDVLDSGGSLTTGSTDNRSSGYETLLLNESSLSTLINVTIFGITDLASYWIHSEDGVSAPFDPDYNKHIGVLITGGVAITGHDDSNTPSTEGNTGSLWVASGIYGDDHHTRADGIYSQPALYIDGNLSTSGNIRGHSFSTTNFRTYANVAISLDEADDIQFSGAVWEFPSLSGVTGADASGGFLATAATQDVFIFGGAGTAQPNLQGLYDNMAGKLTVAGGGFQDGLMVADGDSGVRIGGTNEDSVVQFVDDGAFNSSVSDWVIRRDDSDGDRLKFLYDNSLAAALTTSNQMALNSGSAAAPSVTFAADTDTGMYHPATDELGFAINGTQFVGIDSNNLRVGNIANNTANDTIAAMGRVSASTKSGSAIDLLLARAGSTLGALYSIQAVDGGDNNTDWVVRTFTNENVTYKVGGQTVFGYDADGLDIESGRTLKVGGTDVVGAQQAAISDPAETTADNNAAIDSILAALRAHGLIAN